MLDPNYWHVSIDARRVVSMLDESWKDMSDPGICLLCGTEHHGIEPDAEHLDCDHCQADQVTGIELIAARMMT